MREIRKVLSSDMDRIKVIYEKAFERSEGISKYYMGFNDYVEFCVERGYAYVAVEDSNVCGVILGYEKPDMFEGKNFYIELLAVLPEYQKKGIGTELLNTIKKSAQSNGIKELSLRTACYMESYQIYKKYGFKDTRDDQRYMVMNIRKKDEG